MKTGRMSAARRRAPLWALVILLVVSGAPAVAAGERGLEGDPFRGREILSTKLCTQCHSVWGYGGTLGPELSSAVAGKSWLDLVGDFWNHTPSMIDAMQERGHAWPSLEREEMADLLSFLYYLRLFDEAGDRAKGAITYTRLGCPDCHSIRGQGGNRGGPLDRFAAYLSPVVLAQAMWNAGPAMQEKQVGRGGTIPQFSRGDLSDIQAYIRAQGTRREGGVRLLPVPDPSRGVVLFRSKGCVGCHPPGGGEGPDLAASALGMTVSEIGAALWNHSYAMGDRMRARGIPFPRFEGSEMADLISSIYLSGFFREKGSPERGAAVFRERGCASCHGAKGGKAPDLAGSRVALDPILLSTAMWNHSPQMHQLMAEQGVGWPTLERGDMVHLAAYLKEAATSAAAKQP